MQRRILLVALVAVALAVTLLGAPLAYLQRQYLREAERGELVRQATQIAVHVPRDLRETGGHPTLTPDEQQVHHVAIYTAEGHVWVGEGPDEPDEIVRAALKGQPADGFAGRDLVAAVPVMRGDDVVAVVRTSSPRQELDHRERLTIGAVAVVALFAALMASLLALRLSRRLSAPIRELRSAAEELGDGNFAARAPESGIGELDAVAGAMNATALRLGQLVDRERAFAAHASHQLRTPLTALRLRLDSGLRGDPARLPEATGEALTIVDDLEATVEDLLAVSRGRTSALATLDLDGLLAGLPNRWAGLLAAEGRPLRIRSDEPPPARGRTATVRQVLDVLLDNAYRHGGGAVQVVARESSGGGVAIDVVDEGRPGAAADVDARFAQLSSGRTGSRDVATGPLDLGAVRAAAAPPPPRNAGPAADPDAPRRTGRRRGTGIGLGLARSLLVADGGRLLLTSEPGRTCATVLLPADEASATVDETVAGAADRSAPGVPAGPPAPPAVPAPTDTWATPGHRSRG